jgi:hypothetical protein
MMPKSVENLSDIRLDRHCMGGPRHLQNENPAPIGGHRRGAVACSRNKALGGGAAQICAYWREHVNDLKVQGRVSIGPANRSVSARHSEQQPPSRAAGALAGKRPPVGLRVTRARGEALFPHGYVVAIRGSRARSVRRGRPGCI